MWFREYVYKWEEKENGAGIVKAFSETWEGKRVAVDAKGNQRLQML